MQSNSRSRPSSSAAPSGASWPSPSGGRSRAARTSTASTSRRSTDIKPDWFDQRPVLFHHALDETLKDADPRHRGRPDARGRRLVGHRLAGPGQPATGHRSTSSSSRARCTARRAPWGTSSARTTRRARSSSGRTSSRPSPRPPPTSSPGPAPVKALDHFSSAGIAVDGAVRGLLTELDSSSDLRTDLPSGGEDAAMAKLSAQLDQLEEMLARLRD